MATKKQIEAARENGRKARGIHFNVPKGFKVSRHTGTRKAHRKSTRKSGRK